MNNRKVYIKGVWYITIVFLILTSCSTPAKLGESKDKYKVKYEPYDMFFFQRTYPMDRFQSSAYFDGLREAQLATNQNARTQGINTPWTLQGPGNIGARVNCIAIQPGNENLQLAGYSGGGIWKTTDGGNSWLPVFDQFAYLAIGAIAFDPLNPNIVYAGTGDPNITAYPFLGNGIYKSVDAGDNWTFIGPGDANIHIISKIIVQPGNSNILYASSMGTPFARSVARGVYKSTNGGTSWTKILVPSDTTGVIDLVMDPSDPNTLYAAAWERIHTNTVQYARGRGARIWKTTDGGSTWTRLSGGLPLGRNSRIGLALNPTNPQQLFAVYVDSVYQFKGIWRTNNGGTSWTPTYVSNGTDPVSSAFSGFGWFFGQIRLHPTNPQRIYLMGILLWESTDGGQTWNIAQELGTANTPYDDKHEMIFTPSGQVLLGTDGGIWKRPLIGGNAWSRVDNIPGTQFYRIGYNPHKPERYYGGAQDHGTVSGTANQMQQWNRIRGQDGFSLQFHPTDSLTFYVETQYGGILRTTDGGNNFGAATVGLGDAANRNWDMPYLLNKHHPTMLYAGTNRVWRSLSFNRWSPISQDLTDGGTPAGLHTITSIDQSQRDSSRLYVGTSDANVWTSANAGSTWQNITIGLPNRYVTSIKASPDSTNHVYVTHSGYRDNDNTPRIHFSKNAGQTWIPISGDLPNLAVNDIIIMPGNAGQVLFAATDGGVYLSVNAGTNWNRLGAGMPVVPVYDMEYNVQRNQLVAGTHARGIYSFPLDSVMISPNPMFSFKTGRISKPIPNVNFPGVTVGTGANNQPVITDNQGEFSFPFTPGGTCSIQPVSPNDFYNGVSTLDLVLISRHILGIRPFTSPYYLVAADVNRSGTITGLDIVNIRRLLLRVDTVLLGGTASWRFLKSNTVVTNTSLPLVNSEVHSCSATGATDFLAIKSGDVNGSATNFKGGSIASGRAIQNLNLPDLLLLPGQEVQVPVALDNIGKLMAIAAAFEWSSDIELLEVLPGVIPQADFIIEDGHLRFLWLNEQNSIPSGILFTLVLTARTTTLLKEALGLDKTFLCETVGQNDQEFDLNLRFQSTINEDQNQVKVICNAVNGSKWLDYQINQAGQCTWYDVQGRVVRRQSMPSGKQRLPISFNHPGVYYYEILVGNQKITGNCYAGG